MFVWKDKKRKNVSKCTSYDVIIIKKTLKGIKHTLIYYKLQIHKRK